MDCKLKVAWLNSKTNKDRNVNGIFSVSTNTHSLPAGKRPIRRGKKLTKKNLICDVGRYLICWRWYLQKGDFSGDVQWCRKTNNCFQKPALAAESRPFMRLWGKMVSLTPFVGHTQTNSGEYEDKWVSSACLSGHAHTLMHVLFPDFKIETLKKWKTYAASCFRNPFTLPGDRERCWLFDTNWRRRVCAVCHCASSRPLAASIVIKPRLCGDRVEPAQCQFTRFTRHSWVWVGRVQTVIMLELVVLFVVCFFERKTKRGRWYSVWSNFAIIDVPMLLQKKWDLQSLADI